MAHHNLTRIFFVPMLILFWGSNHTVSQTADLQAAPLTIFVVPITDVAVNGATTQWLVSLEAHDDLIIQSIDLVDRQHWMLVDNQFSAFHMRRDQTLIYPLSVIPTHSGVFQPAIRVVYAYQFRTNEMLIAPTTSIDVHPVDSFVQLELTTSENTVRVSDVFTATVRVRNLSPFALSNIVLDGDGFGLAWHTPIITTNLPTNESVLLVISGKITEINPRPQLMVQYEWVDDAMRSNEYNATLVGEPLQLVQPEKSFWDRLPDEVYTALFGLIIGIVTTASITWAKSLIDHQLREKANRNKVKGMLQIFVLQAEYAAESGYKLETGIVETIFKDDELYEVLMEYKLVDKIKTLWKLAESHNQSLNDSAGAQHSERLYSTAKAFGSSIEKLETKT